MCLHLIEMKRVKATCLQDHHQLMVKLELEPRSPDSQVHAFFFFFFLQY